MFGPYGSGAVLGAHKLGLGYMRGQILSSPVALGAHVLCLASMVPWRVISPWVRSGCYRQHGVPGQHVHAPTIYGPSKGLLATLKSLVYVQESQIPRYGVIPLVSNLSQPSRATTYAVVMLGGCKIDHLEALSEYSELYTLHCVYRMLQVNGIVLKACHMLVLRT